MSNNIISIKIYVVYIPLTPPINFDGSGTCDKNYNDSWTHQYIVEQPQFELRLPCHWQWHSWSRNLDAASSNQRCRIPKYNRATSSWNRSSKISFFTSISVAASKISCPLRRCVWNMNSKWIQKVPHTKTDNHVSALSTLNSVISSSPSSVQKLCQKKSMRIRSKYWPNVQVLSDLTDLESWWSM